MCAYPHSQVKVLRGREATRANIEKELVNLKNCISDLEHNDECTVVVFFSGNGAPYGKKKCLLPYGYKKGDDLATQAIGGKFLYDNLDPIKAGNVLLFLNATYPRDVRLPDGDGDYNLVIDTEPLEKQQIKNLGEKFFVLSATQNISGAYELYSRELSKSISPFAVALSRAFSGKDSALTNIVSLDDVLKIFTEYLGLKRELPKGRKSGDPVGCRTEVGASGLAGDFERRELDSDRDEEETGVDDLAVGTTTNFSGNFTSNASMFLGNSFGNGTRF
jgi:hypothetical protein